MRQPLYQVHVETREGKLLAVGPAMIRQACEMFCATIKAQIKAGREREWANPHIAQVLNLT
jgi:hypothetical protein